MEARMAIENLNTSYNFWHWVKYVILIPGLWPLLETSWTSELLSRFLCSGVPQGKGIKFKLFFVLNASPCHVFILITVQSLAFSVFQKLSFLKNISISNYACKKLK